MSEEEQERLKAIMTEGLTFEQIGPHRATKSVALWRQFSGRAQRPTIEQTHARYRKEFLDGPRYGGTLRDNLAQSRGRGFAMSPTADEQIFYEYSPSDRASWALDRYRSEFPWMSAEWMPACRCTLVPVVRGPQSQSWTGRPAGAPTPWQMLRDWWVRRNA